MRLDHVSYVASHDELINVVQRMGANIGSAFIDGGIHPRFGTRNFTLPLANGHYLEVVLITQFLKRIGFNNKLYNNIHLKETDFTSIEKNVKIYSKITELKLVIHNKLTIINDDFLKINIINNERHFYHIIIQIIKF